MSTKTFGKIIGLLAVIVATTAGAAQLSELDQCLTNAVLAMNRSDFTTALTNFNRALELRLDDSFIWHGRGCSKCGREDWSGAVADFDKAIELAPNYAPAYVSRANAKLNLDDLAGALADCNRAVELHPNAVAYRQRGLVEQARLGQQIKERQAAKLPPPPWDCSAELDYGRAIKLDPQDVYTYYNRGQLRRYHGDTNGAAADLKKAFKLDPQAGEPK